MQDLNLEALRAEIVGTLTVQMGQREVPVSGLPLDAIMDICRRHWNDLSGLFDTLVGQVESGQIDPELNSVNWLGGALLSALPKVGAEIIALCAGWSLEAAAVVAEVPFPVQLEALDKITALTFTAEMPPKKVIEIVVRTLVGGSKLLIASPA